MSASARSSALDPKSEGRCCGQDVQYRFRAPVSTVWVKRHQPRGNLITDAQLAALAIEHGIELCSADTDFARFTEVRWNNPLA